MKRADEYIRSDESGAEYFVYDPHGEYLTPRLQGHRLGVEGTFARVVPDEQGRLDCRQLGLTLELDGGELVLRDALSGELLLTEADANANEAKRLASRNAELEAELQRLRHELDQRGG